MSSFSTFASGSRAAPRDASDRTGRRPKSVYMDERQFRTVDDDFEEEAPPKKTGALESKDRDYHIKAVHRSFATPASARQSARKAVDEIVLGDEERRFKQRLNQELDADRIARLREMNKKRLDALEKKLADLQRQKEEQDGEHVPAPSDGEDGKEEGASPPAPRGKAGTAGGEPRQSLSSSARVIGDVGLAPMLYASRAHEASSVYRIFDGWMSTTTAFLCSSN